MIYGDEYKQFSPERWVNVYRRDRENRAVYYATIQVKYLIHEDPLAEFLLEFDDVVTLKEFKFWATLLFQIPLEALKALVLHNLADVIYIDIYHRDCGDRMKYYCTVKASQVASSPIYKDKEFYCKFSKGCKSLSINGIYGDEAHLFSPEQWVNVYVNQCDRAIYYSTTQVKYVKDHEDCEEFLLEPVTEDGEVMSVSEAKQCCR